MDVYRIGSWLMVAVSGLLMSPSALAIPIAHLQVEGEPGDFVSGGNSLDVTYDSSNAVVNSTVQLLSPGEPADISFYLDGPSVDEDRLALLGFRTVKLAVALQPGTYLNAQAFGVEQDGFPGLGVVVFHRGLSRLTGSFTIFKISFTPDQSTLTSFIVEFDQRQRADGPGLRGRFEYQAAGIIPEPSAALLVGLGLSCLGYRRRQA